MIAGDGFSALLYVLDGDCSDVAASCIEAVEVNGDTTIPISTVPGQTYYIIVDGNDGDGGTGYGSTYSISISDVASF